MQRLARDVLEKEGIIATVEFLSQNIGQEDALLDSLTYLEICESSTSIALLLAHRFGVRTGDRVVLACKGHNPAEICAILACIRYSPYSTSSSSFSIKRDTVDNIRLVFHNFFLKYVQYLLFLLHTRCL